jgi:hypothetical protein
MPISIDDLHHRAMEMNLKPLRNSNGFTCLCPGHDDQEHRSLSISEGNDGRILVKCFVCGEDRKRKEAIISAFGCQWPDLMPPQDGGEGGCPIPSDTRAHVQSPPGLTLEQYAEAKRLPLDFLKSLGLSDFTYHGSPAVRIPYLDPVGEQAVVRFRLRLEGDDRFRWRRGSKPMPYGLSRLHLARAAGHIVRVEGESCAQTHWLHAEPALGVPGADLWDDEWDSYLEGIPIIYDVVEPDRGGEAWLRRLAQSSLRHRVRLVRLGEFKDSSDLYLAEPEGFRARWQQAKANATPWTDAAQEETDRARQEAWDLCSELAQAARILDSLDEFLERRGLVGEKRNARLIYLAATTRHLDRLVSVAIKGPSSVGKSQLLEMVLKTQPSSGYHTMTAMSERALAFTDEPLQHRHLVIYEVTGLSGDLQSYLIRSLLSEGRLVYDTVEKTRDGLQPRRIEKEGPTGLLTTTTAIHLHPENETRFFSIYADDSTEQTAKVLKALGREHRKGGEAAADELAKWHALQRWIGTGSSIVTIPYAVRLATLIPPVAVRLRRDFGAVLNLIRAHALLHQATRTTDEQGSIVATLDDYAVVREVVAGLISEGVGATVSPIIRETVAVVSELTTGGGETTVKAVAGKLKLDPSAVSRRVRQAMHSGYLINREERKGKPLRLVVGDPLPDEQVILPDVERLHDCTIAPGGMPSLPLIQQGDET